MLSIMKKIVIYKNKNAITFFNLVAMYRL